ncbi:hypothetical protein HK405_005839 [Cladochytrium tenue]|nr:hypothetical protein HK405_005839 [Cladochytrium tenue]
MFADSNTACTEALANMRIALASRSTEINDVDESRDTPMRRESSSDSGRGRLTAGHLVSMGRNPEVGGLATGCRLGVNEDLAACGFAADPDAAAAYCADQPHALCCDFVGMSGTNGKALSTLEDDALRDSLLGRLVGYHADGAASSPNTGAGDTLTRDAETLVEGTVRGANRISTRNGKGHIALSFMKWTGLSRSLAALSLGPFPTRTKAGVGDKMSNKKTTTPTQTTSSSSGNSSSSKGLGGGAIAGIVLASVCAAAVAVGTGMVFYRRRAAAVASRQASSPYNKPARPFDSIARLARDGRGADVPGPAVWAADLSTRNGGGGGDQGGDDAASDGEDVPVLGPSSDRRLRAVTYAYEPVQVDEIALGVGDVVRVHTAYDDGWAAGMNVTTGRFGTFPLACLDEPEEEDAGAVSVSP